jgi:hypothetical protein
MPIYSYEMSFQILHSDWNTFQVLVFWSSPQFHLRLDQIARTWNLVLSSSSPVTNIHLVKNNEWPFGMFEQWNFQNNERTMEHLHDWIVTWWHFVIMLNVMEKLIENEE